MKLTASGTSKQMQHLSDDEVLANLGSVIGSRRNITAELVAYLGEVEARRLELREACSSMYEFCCRRLKLSEGSAHRHIAAARIARRYPMVLDLLRQGRIHVTALSMLQTYLKDERHADLLGQACDKSKAEVQLLIRSRFPRKDVADAIRPVAVPAQLGGCRSDVAVDGPATFALTAAGESVPANQSVAPDSGPATAGQHEPWPRVSPLSAQRFHVQFTASTSLKDKLERALDLMSHSNPKRDLATVIERGLDLVLADLEKKKHGKTKRAKRSAGTKHGDFSRQARREIYERDCEQCTYVSPSGERCRARAFVQLDHETPRSCGGAGTTRNGRLLCRAHNLFEAEKVFGREFMESKIHLHQQHQRASRCNSGHSPEESSDAGTGSERADSVDEADEGDSMTAAIHLRRQRQQRASSESRRAPEDSGVVAASVRVGLESPEESDVVAASVRVGLESPEESDVVAACVDEADEGDSMTAAIHLRQQRQQRASSESRHVPDRISVGGNANLPGTPDALGCWARDAGVSAMRVAAEAPERKSEVLPSREMPDQACVGSAELESKLLSALTNMGFRRGESRKAVAALVPNGDSHRPDAEHLVTLLRQALAMLVP